MKQNAILLIYGEGGHRAQMQRLLKKLQNEADNSIIFIGLHENDDRIEEIENFQLIPLRDKYSKIKTFVNIPKSLFIYLRLFAHLVRHYNVQGVVSTGPGIAIIPSLVFKMLGKKIVFLETWSRFDTQSLTGKIMYKIADRFYIQNKEQMQFYPNAIYGGLL